MEDVALQFSNALADAVERASASVVRVEGGRRRPSSGVVWSADGLVVTVAHAVERERDIEVGLEGGERVTAALVGRDLATDVALLRVEGRTLSPSPRVRPEALRRGQLVLSLTRPGRTARVAVGVLRVLGDEFRTPRGAAVERYLQSSVGLEPGFSGGALLDVSGALIGLNSAGLLRGTPLALGVDTLERVAAQLLAEGRVRRGYLGVSSHPVRLPDAVSAGLGRGYGLIVVGLQPDGPADRAGVVLGDVLLALDGEALESIEDLQAALEPRAERAAALRLLRGGREETVSVAVGARG